MKCIIIAVGLLYLSSGIRTDEVRLVDLNPDEAANLIEKQDQSLKFAPLVESNVPAVRFIGNEPQQVVEDVYKANQYHGQDGLGAYVYGYSVPDIAKTEKKTRQGDVRGAYNYVSGDGQEIKIEYWDDGTGFHQIDNIPKVPLVQIEDTPEVKAARAEHERLWKELAEANSHAPQNPYQNTNVQQYTNQQQQQQQQAHYQGQATAFQPQSSNYNQPQAYQAPKPVAQQYQAPPQPQTFQAQFPNHQARPAVIPQQPPQSYQAPQQLKPVFTPSSQQPKPAFPLAPQPYQAPQQPNIQPYQAPPQPQSFQAQFPNNQQQKPAFPQAPKQQPYQAPQQPKPLVPQAPQAYHAAQQPKPTFPQQPQQPYQQQESKPQVYQAHPQPQSFQAQFPNQGGKPAFNQPQQYQAQASSFQPNKNTYSQVGKSGDEDDGSYRAEHAEESGDPKGFYYNFDYNVGIIKNGQGKSLQGGGGDPMSLFNQNKKLFEQNYGPNSQPQNGPYPSYMYKPQ